MKKPTASPQSLGSLTHNNRQQFFPIPVDGPFSNKRLVMKGKPLRKETSFMATCS